MDSRVADEQPRGSKTVEGPSTDDNEYEVCDLVCEIKTASFVKLQWGTGRLVPLPCTQPAVSGTESLGRCRLGPPTMVEETM